MSDSEGVALIKDGGAVLIVAHGPQIDSLIHHVTGRTVDTSRGTLAGIQIKDGVGTLTHLLTPKQIASMVKPARGSDSDGRAAALSAALSEPVTLACESTRRGRQASRRLTRRQRGATR
jgi:hypothetical protein